MYEEDIEAETPPDDATIWRYLSYEKYIDLLCTESLFLCRLDKFEDPWEFKWTPQDIRNSPYHEQDLEGPDGLIETEFKRYIFANCWHLNEHESAAMWELYSSKNTGIAIKSSIGKLKNSLKHEEKKLRIGKIQYIDNYDDYVESRIHPGDGTFAILEQCFRKRKSFKHEDEVRLVFWTTERKDFYCAKLDLKELIENIYLSPKMEDWLAESIKNVSEKKFNIDRGLFKKSDLYDRNVK